MNKMRYLPKHNLIQDPINFLLKQHRNNRSHPNIVPKSFLLSNIIFRFLHQNPIQQLRLYVRFLYLLLVRLNFSIIFQNSFSLSTTCNRSTFINFFHHVFVSCEMSIFSNSDIREFLNWFTTNTKSRTSFASIHISGSCIYFWTKTFLWFGTTSNVGLASFKRPIFSLSKFVCCKLITTMTRTSFWSVIKNPLRWKFIVGSFI